MMKILSILLTICALGSFQPDRANPQIVLEMLRDGNGRMLYMMCDDNVRSSVDAGQLSSLWKGIESQMGLYVSNSAWYGLDGVPGGKWCNISFENGKAALVDGWKERDTVLCSGKYRLPAALTMPELSNANCRQ